MRISPYPIILASVSSWLLAGCTAQCLDDGFAGSQQKEACLTASATNTMSASATETESASATETESASVSVSVSVSNSNTMTMTATETMTATITDGTGNAGDWCLDADMDGFGDPSMCMPGIPGEDPPDGYVEIGEDGLVDCDDGDPSTFPGAAELDDPKACMTDADDDGYGDSTPSNPDAIPGTDCDDDDATTHPGIDDGMPEACMTDADDDGHGDSSPSNPDAIPGDDCDDADPNTFPGAAELDDPEACMTDADDDGYGDSTPSNPDATAGTDCDDASATTHPGAAENEDPALCTNDDDDDGYGDDDPEVDGVDPGKDCDDDDLNTFPGAAEKESDELCMKDEDMDGYGEARPMGGGGGVVGGADCFDANADLNPGNQQLFSVLEGGDIGSVDVDTGAIDVIGTVDIIQLEGEWSVISASVSPDNGLTYVANAAQNRLSMLDYCDGGEPVELPVHGRSICGIAFDPVNVLYGVDSNADELVIFDPETGNLENTLPLTLDGETVNIGACGMAFDCASGNLLVSDSLQKRILSVDPTTGDSTVVATVDVAPGAGLAYDSLNKAVLTNSIKDLYSILIDGSNTSELKTTLQSSVNDLDYGPICQ